MIKHKIYARHSMVERADRLPITLIKNCIRASLDSEGVDMPCEVSVLITDDRVIREINLEYRGIDKPTDVLSFPMVNFSLPGWDNTALDAADPETGLTPLGEIVISAQRVAAQAIEYNQTPERELMYLTIHSVLHLLGYDHADEAEGKKKMRKREEQIMHEMGIQND